MISILKCTFSAFPFFLYGTAVGVFKMKVFFFTCTKLKWKKKAKNKETQK